MRPWVIMYNAVSLDGRITAFDADVPLYYERAAAWDTGAVLMGSETVLAGFGARPGETREESAEAVRNRPRIPDDGRPLLVVPDSRGRIRFWGELLKMPYIKDVLVLCSRSTPGEYLEFLDARGIDRLVAGDEKADLGEALTVLREKHGIKKVRTDCGGVLNGHLLAAGLVDEIRVLLHPEMAGDAAVPILRSVRGAGSDGPIKLELAGVEKLKSGILYLIYRVLKAAGAPAGYGR